MGKKTSVVLSRFGERIRAKHVNVFGLQAIMETGLYLFDKLPDDNARAEAVRTVAQLAEQSESDQEPAEAAIIKLKDIAGRIEPGTIKLLSPEEQELVDGIRKLLESDAEAQKRAAREGRESGASSAPGRRKAGR